MQLYACEATVGQDCQCGESSVGQDCQRGSRLRVLPLSGEASATRAARCALECQGFGLNIRR
jgi:hypothetical protein